MCNIYICLLKVLYSTSFELISSDEFLCVKTGYGNYYGAEMSDYLSKNVKEHIINNPDIIHVSFPSVVLGDQSLDDKFIFYTRDNISDYYIAWSNRSTFNSETNIIDGVMSSVCTKKNYWLFIDYASYIKSDYVDKTDNDETNFLVIDRNGDINIPDLKYDGIKWNKSFNYDSSDKNLFYIMNSLWSRFYQKHNSKITVDYV